MKGSIMKILFIGILFLGLQACVSLPECEFDTGYSPESSAKIVVYRKHGFVGFAAVQGIGLNDCFAGKLENGSVLSYIVPAGPNKVLLFNDIGQKEAELGLIAEAGKEYFARYYLSIDGVYMIGDITTTTGSQGLTLVPQEQAIAEIEEIGDLNRKRELRSESLKNGRGTR